jgi:hypothetical protein
MLVLIDYNGSRDRIERYLLKWGVLKNIIETGKVIMYVRKKMKTDHFGWFGQYLSYGKGPRIFAYAPNWIFIKPLKDWLNAKILLHELGHAFGIEKHSNISCLMFEAHELVEFLVVPFQFLRGFRFCKKCKRRFILGQSDFLARWESRNVR